MDIQHLVDRLEDLIDEGRHMPFSRYTMIDEERALELIDQMRISIPEEIEKAARVLAQRDRILAQANEEAARIVQQAREQSEQMVDREEMVQMAQDRANKLFEDAKREAAMISNEADQYALRSLQKLEAQLARMMAVVRDSINEASHTPLPPQPAQQPTQAAQPAPAEEQRTVQRPMVDVSAGPDENKNK